MTAAACAAAIAKTLSLAAAPVLRVGAMAMKAMLRPERRPSRQHGRTIIIPGKAAQLVSTAAARDVRAAAAQQQPFYPRFFPRSKLCLLRKMFERRGPLLLGWKGGRAAKGGFHGVPVREAPSREVFACRSAAPRTVTRQSLASAAFPSIS